MLWIDADELFFIYPLGSAHIFGVGIVLFMGLWVDIYAERVNALDKRFPIVHFITEFIADFEPADTADSSV